MQCDRWQARPTPRVGVFFIGDAIGSMAAGIAWTWGGWQAVCTAGAAFGLVALLVDWIGGSE
ncbi:hypothetical protein [Mesorhizobium sangaii]|uniref:Putative MFS family arabinose efflux permease n=1 Tax=Mesorhizobium sangaii TaxID=505389 RepID=A0A841PG16_9HYPH|nr:hypothetical protein [Mesorhizobium sangaii]MBB6412543.1 putative MFS family arabinose efflux permease [Mesorhizobium sangaii]